MLLKNGGGSNAKSAADSEDFEVHLNDFLQPMAGAGYRPKAISWYRWALMHLRQWMVIRGHLVARLDEAILHQFQGHLSGCRCPGRKSPVRKHQAWVARPAKRFLAYLRTRGVVTTPALSLPPQLWDGSLLQEFRSWMHVHRGVKDVTVERYRPLLERLLNFLGEDPGTYTAESLRRFVTQELQSRGVRRPHVRMFLRWAVATGKCPVGLESCIPTVAQWRLSSLPKYLAEADVDRVIAACDLATNTGIRDRAILLLLGRLGLRAGDIVKLRLDDIDWIRAALRVIGKGRREAWLPLPQDVGDAILAYLEQSRPSTTLDWVFLRVLAPVAPLGPTGTVATIVKWAMQRAGIPRPPAGYGGGRTLRHSVATTMLRHGASLQDVGKLLRHQSIDTTAIYAKVDVERLRQVAQPWPEVTTC